MKKAKPWAKQWVWLGVLGLLEVAAQPGESAAQEPGWQPVVTEAQESAYAAQKYAPTVRIGQMLIGSGVIGTTRNGDNRPQAQFRRALERMIDILEANQLTLADVAEITTYHVNLGELGSDFVEVKDEFWPEPPYPAWTAIGVERLFLDSAVIEVRFTAAVPPGL